MKQVVRRVIDRKGRVALLDLPEPHMGEDQVLVQNHYSLISTGTETSTLSKTPLELVRQTIADPWMRHVVKQTVFATGVTQTGRRVWQEMTMPREIGYSGAGRVLAVGREIQGVQVGSNVAYAATGHAELVAPYGNHIVSVGAGVDLRHAAFVTVGAIALQSLRRGEIELGAVVAVYGLGLVGQVCAQLARAAGAVVVGIDVDERRNRLARKCGAHLTVNPASDDLERTIHDFTGKHGVDATIICAASDSNEIINSSMQITRRQGRVVIVGYVGLDVHPKEFLHKEIDLRYSRAYGPGSYHTGYEKGRLDYPYGYVRWTENRNLGEVVRLIGTGALNLEPLIGGTFSLDQAQSAFDALQEDEFHGVAALIAYDADAVPDRRRTLPVRPRPGIDGKVGVSIVGVGNHVLGKHLPNLAQIDGVEIRALVSATGKNASMVAAKADATVNTTEMAEALADPGTDALLICSSQPEHADHLVSTIEAGKAIFVEKPMVTRLADFRRVVRLMDEKPVLFTLGLNRRYSPIVTRMRAALGGPAGAVHYIVTQPYVPPDHWTLDPVEGGGRLITEGEHFIDLCHLLIQRKPVNVFARALGTQPEDLRTLCNFDLTIHYEGAVAHITFNESGSLGYPREKITAFGSARVVVLDDFGELTVHGESKVRGHGTRLRKKEMGHPQALAEFVKALKGEKNEMLGWDDSFSATLCMFAAQESLRSGAPVDLRQFEDLVREAEVSAPPA
ncbi:MAG TPA: bi-domain-containing oxidoreductase [Rhodothermales bacterium]|nr:bi-domain-containing oxidoreductase [Rhodothermales bacterium]